MAKTWLKILLIFLGLALMAPLALADNTYYPSASMPGSTTSFARVMTSPGVYPVDSQGRWLYQPMSIDQYGQIFINGSISAASTINATATLPTLAPGSQAPQGSLAGATYTQPVFGSASGGGTQVDATHGLPASLLQGGSALSTTNGLYSDLLQGNAVISATNGLFANVLQGNAVLSASNPLPATLEIAGAVNSATNGVYFNQLQANAVLSATNPSFVEITDGTAVNGSSHPIYTAAAASAFALGAIVDLGTGASPGANTVNGYLQALDATIGPAAAGTAASKSLLDGCIYHSSRLSPSDGQQVAFTCDSDGSLFIAASDGDIATLGAKADTASTATDTTPASIVAILKEISSKEQTPASRAVTNAGSFAVQSQVNVGNANTEMHVCGSYAYKHISSATDTQLVAVNSTNNIYICDIEFSAAAAQNFYLEKSTSSTCGTLSQIGILWTLVANQAKGHTAAIYSGMNTGASASLCANTSTSGGLDIGVYYDQY